MSRKQIHPDRLQYLRDYNKEYRKKHAKRFSDSMSFASVDQGELLGLAAVRTYKEVGELMGCSWQRVQQIERHVICRLRNNKELLQHWVEFKTKG